MRALLNLSIKVSHRKLHHILEYYVRALTEQIDLYGHESVGTSVSLSAIPLPHSIGITSQLSSVSLIWVPSNTVSLSPASLGVSYGLCVHKSRFRSKINKAKERVVASRACCSVCVRILGTWCLFFTCFGKHLAERHALSSRFKSSHLNRLLSCSTVILVVTCQA